MTSGIPHRRFIALAFVLLASAEARADSLLFSSDFSDRSDMDWKAYGEHRPARLAVVEGALQISAPVSFRGIYRELPSSVELKSGEAIHLSFHVRFPSLEPARSSGFRFGLFAPSAEDGKVPGADHGYLATVDLGSTARIRLQQDGGGSSFDPLSGRLRGFGTPGPEFALPAQTWIPASLEVRRIDDITVRISVSFGGTSLARDTISGRVPAPIGSVYIGAGNNNASFHLDDIVLSRRDGR